MKLFNKNSGPERLEILARVHSRFNRIYVFQSGQHREMWFRGEEGFFLQSRIDLKNRRHLSLVYTQMMAASLFFCPLPRRILMIGLGGGAFADFLRQRYPGAVLDIVEIDPEVLRLCKKYFFFQESDRCRVHEGDGRLFVQNRRGREAYDLVYLDAFKSGSIPYHLKTRAFYEEIRSILRPSGVVASNLYGKSNRLKPQDRATFVSVFPQVECFEDPDQRATVLIATREAQSWTVEELLDRAERLADSPGFSWPQVARMFRPGRFAEGAAEPFEDDFGPGEFLETVRRNNTDQKGPRPYPIKSFN